ncbi:MAG: DNA-protecting protein DprA [Chromatiales bacterium]|nr:DNA-protecting protein DprA [Chromatiales bacterium]
MKTDIKAWLIVSQAPGLGTLKFHTLLKQIGTPEQIIESSESKLLKAGLEKKTVDFIKNPPDEKITQNLVWASAPNHEIRTLFCRQYPEQLKQIKDAPPLLYIKGNEKLLKEPQIAVVGCRQPTPGGRANAKKIASSLAKAGIMVTSGMAAGIDAVAHESAMQYGPTAAVVATGPDKIYPAKNKPLAERIANQGVLISEFAVGTAPVRSNFPRRNRIISALSFGVVVIEATLRSGALITARIAVEQGKDVFAVPGSIQNPKAQGCHHLIKQGAKLVEKVEDILFELQSQLEWHLKEKDTTETMNKKGYATDKQVELKGLHKNILEAMGYDPVDVDTVVARCGLPVHTVSAAMLTLEMENYVDSDNGVYTRLR